jgi:hypothetical protein
VISTEDSLGESIGITIRKLTLSDRYADFFGDVESVCNIESG